MVPRMTVPWVRTRKTVGACVVPWAYPPVMSMNLVEEMSGMNHDSAKESWFFPGRASATGKCRSALRVPLSIRQRAGPCCAHDVSHRSHRSASHVAIVDSGAIVLNPVPWLQERSEASWSFTWPCPGWGILLGIPRPGTRILKFVSPVRCPAG